MASTREFLCANWDPGQPDCKKTGKHTCSNCYLVVYCGSECQKAHWARHKFECRSSVNQESWEPAWVVEVRQPAFMQHGPGVSEPYGGRKYLWGNAPAIDILRLGSNEGNEYDGDLRLLFAASGDIRNVIKTIAQIPSSFSHSLEATINDRDFEIVGRNLILLLIAFVSDNADEAVDCMIHVWYSAMLRQSDIDFLQTRIRPMIQRICQHLRGMDPGSLNGKTWRFGRKTLRVVLQKRAWIRMLTLIDGVVGLSAGQARAIRTGVTLPVARQDYRERHLYCLTPSRRVAFIKFRQDGNLLPFGHSRDEFQFPNPTIFQSGDIWQMNDNADPLNGWSSEDIANTSSGAATADIYGKLFYHIRGVLHAFLNRLESVDCLFKLYQVDAVQLHEHVARDYFSRIEVSNISDAGWLGIRKTLRSMLPLLQSPLENPHATLITFFMNAVEETMTEKDRSPPNFAERSRTMARLHRYLPPKRMPLSSSDPELIKTWVGFNILSTYDHIFNRYARELSFNKTARYYHGAMKKTNTVIEKWPYRLKLELGQTGAQEEFDRCMGAGTSGKERYVEWKRIVPQA